MIDKNAPYLPVSKSPIWGDSRSYYQEKGIAAWEGNAVPNYVTTNPFIAQAYARVINQFFDTYSSNRPKHEGDDDIRYVLEIGAGSGRFAYHFLQSYLANLKGERPRGPRLVYVMTDISTSTIDFWRSHPQLVPLKEQGLLEFANFNILQDERIELLVSGKTLDAASIQMPIAVIANYVIDSLPHDFFTIRNGQLHERLISYQGADTNSGKGTHWITNKIDYGEQLCSHSYYDSADWNNVLKQYLKKYTDFNLALPIGGFQMLETLSKLSRKPVFLLSSDFGATSELALQQLGPRRVAVNGAYSIHVNYNALKRFAELKGIHVLTDDMAKASLQSMGFVVHPGKRSATSFHREFFYNIMKQGPDEFFMVKKIAEKSSNDLNLDNIIGLLRLSNYDSRIFDLCEMSLKRNLHQVDPWRKKMLEEVLLRIEQMHYRYEPEKDPSLRILQILLDLNAVNAARNLAERKRDILKETAEGRRALAQAVEEEAQKSN